MSEPNRVEIVRTTMRFRATDVGNHEFCRRAWALALPETELHEKKLAGIEAQIAQAKLLRELSTLRYAELRQILSAAIPFLAAIGVATFATLPFWTPLGTLAISGLAIITAIPGLLIIKKVRRISRRIKEIETSHAFSDGRIAYAEMPEVPLLVSDALPLVGKPDFIREDPKGKVPIEMKNSLAPRDPYPSHKLQVGAYCLLVSEHFGNVPHGILAYSDREFKIEFDEALRQRVRSKLREMEEDFIAQRFGRNHNNRNKCAGCFQRLNCPERLP